MANFAIKEGSSYFLYKGSNDEVLGKFGITIEDIMLLEELGILQSGDLYHIRFDVSDEDDETEIYFGDSLAILKRPANSREQSLPVYFFTRIGEELLKLIDITPEFEYEQCLASALKTGTCELKFI